MYAHGLSRTSLDFDHFAHLLAATGKYHVYAFDTVGRGESDWLDPQSAEYYDMPVYVNDILNLLKHLNLEVP
jgi:pimeloyl-ACP methyl ester carboxylesterase